MRIGGFIDASTKDWPKKVVAVIFTVGCNFNCKFCQNKPLLEPSAGEDLTIDSILDRLKNNFLIDGVSITGGEPMLQKDLIQVCEEISKLDMLVSVDTNGSKPEVIEKLLPYINRIALDLKVPLDSDEKRAREIINANIIPQKIRKSIELVQHSKNTQFEIRTTYVKKLHIPSDLIDIMNYLKNINFPGDYVVQQYQYSDGVGEKYMEMFEEPTFEEIKDIITSYTSKIPFNVFARARGIGYKKLI